MLESMKIRKCYEKMKGNFTTTVRKGEQKRTEDHLYAEDSTHLHKTHIRSKNNCGVHTFLRLLTLHNQGLNEAFSTDFIEKYSMSLRAWMIYILMHGI